MKMLYAILNIIILLVFLGAFIFALWYTARRLSIHLVFIPFKVSFIAVAGIAVTSLVILLTSPMFSNSFLSVLNIISGYLLLFILFSFMLFGLLHIVQFVCKPPLLWGGTAVLAMAFIITSVSAVLGSLLIVKEVDIKISMLEKEVTIMLISDTHIGHHRGHKFLSTIVDETNNRNPDLILIAGDLADGKPAFLPSVFDPLLYFNAPAYFVTGNHDVDIDRELLIKLLEKNNIRFLNNEIIETHGIQLIGLDYMKADENSFDMHPSEKSETIKSVLLELPIKKDVPSVLMHHSPVGTVYADAAGIDLMVSGHTHGGQIFPFSLIGELMFPFNSGLHQQGNTKIFVSNGAGTYLIRARLGSFNEINLIRLIPENQ